MLPPLVLLGGGKALNETLAHEWIDLAKRHLELKGV